MNYLFEVKIVTRAKTPIGSFIYLKTAKLTAEFYGQFREDTASFILRSVIRYENFYELDGVRLLDEALEKRPNPLRTIIRHQRYVHVWQIIE